MPMYPIPESVRAASAVTHADALFCVSEEIPGPVMLGWLTPVVLMPESFLSFEEDAQCGVACHELIHVRWHDWLVTVIEELAGALLWFNPAIWPLLAQARLAREQLVDAEVVRLTAAHEPYIDALLAIARGGSGLDLAPAPLFLRRRHLTQRVHSLLKETQPSRQRLIASYAMMALTLGVVGWAGAMTFPLAGRAASISEAPISAASVSSASADAPRAALIPPASIAPAPAAPIVPALPDPATGKARASRHTPSVPVPQDPHELAVGGIRVLESPDDIRAAAALMDRAQQNARLTIASTPPYRFDVSFTSAGNAAHTGPGTLSEIGQFRNRRWTADLDGFEVTRWTASGWTVEDHRSASIPMRIETLRDAIHWPAAKPAFTGTIRSLDASWSGRPVTCLLYSDWNGEALAAPGRLWEESEYCVDTAAGLLRIQSIAPGTYTVYDYDGNLGYHDRPMADHITIFTGGAMVADARFSITDMTAQDQDLLKADAAANGPVVVMDAPKRLPLNTPNPVPSKNIEPVIVAAVIDGGRNVIEEELCAAADPALAQAALDLVKQTRFAHRPSTQYQLFVNVKFMPSGQ